MDIFLHIFVVKIVMMFVLKEEKMRIEAEDGPFLINLRFIKAATNHALNVHFCRKRKLTISSDMQLFAECLSIKRN